MSKTLKSKISIMTARCHF